MKNNKGIEFTKSQIVSLNNGATKFLFPCKTVKIPMTRKGKNVGFVTQQNINLDSFKIKKGDKDIFVQEEFIEECPNGICIKKDYELEEWESLEEYGYINKASKMTKEQSRYSFSECIDVKVIRVQDIEWVMGFHFQRFYNRCMEERNINRTYKDNDYVFSVEFKR